MDYDLVISGRVFYRGELQQAEVGVKDGRVLRVAKSLPHSFPRTDYGDRWVLPAGIDPHVHFRTPGAERKETFSTGGTAAAVGGVTTVLDMPNNTPPVTDLEGIKEKVKRAGRESPIDIGFFLGAVEGGGPFEDCREVFAVKVYMGSTTGSLLVRDLSSLSSYLGLGGVPLTFHAEDQEFLERRRLKVGRPRDLLTYSSLRPPEAERRAVERIGKWAPPPERVHIAHVTTASTLKEARERGYSTEVTPHHLLLDIKNAPDGAWCKVNPPLRSRGERAALLEAFKRGEIDMLASDHAPHLPEEKEQEFESAPAGIPGVETSLPLLLYMVRRGEISLQRLVEASSSNPAYFYGMEDRGEIAEGKRADLMVVDWREVVKVDPEEVHSRCGWTPYEGFPAIFPAAVYLKGELIVEDGNFLGGRGEVLIREGEPLRS